MESFINHNNREERFDFYKWSAPFFYSPKAVAEYIDSLNLQDKSLSRINIIGLGHCQTDNEYLYHKLTDAGIKLDDDWYYTYNKDKIMVPWNICICEPIQLIFNDRTSLEFLPTNDGGARIGVNSIPQNISDGLNRSSFDANLFFGELLGAKYSEFSVIILEKNCIHKSFSSKTSKYEYQFNFGLDYIMILNHDGRSGYYSVEIQRHAESISNIPYAIASASTKEVRQIEIINGPCGGAVFNIQPIKMNKPIEEDWKLDRFGISICEDDIEEFLYVFLRRHYDPNVQEGYRKSSNQEFAWYDENLFTFDSIRNLLCDIQNECTLLLNNYDNSELKKAIAYSTWIPHTLRYQDDEERIIKEEIQKNRISVAIDFYERFCRQIENMMLLPDKDGILFYGP